MNRDLEYLVPEDHFFSFDLGLSSALVTLGYTLVAIDKTNRNKAQFIFRRYPGIDPDISSYWNGELQLGARSLFDNQKMLKNRLYSD